MKIEDAMQDDIFNHISKIETEEQWESALAIVDCLMDIECTPDSPEGERLLRVFGLVFQYEAHSFPMDTPRRRKIKELHIYRDSVRRWLRLRLSFWELMGWIDNHINHPVWDWVLTRGPYSGDDTLLDKACYRFCRWAHVNWSDCLDQIEVEWYREEYKWVS